MVDQFIFTALAGAMGGLEALLEAVDAPALPVWFHMYM